MIRTIDKIFTKITSENTEDYINEKVGANLKYSEVFGVDTTQEIIQTTAALHVMNKLITETSLEQPSADLHWELLKMLASHYNISIYQEN